MDPIGIVHQVVPVGEGFSQRVVVKIEPAGDVELEFLGLRLGDRDGLDQGIGLDLRDLQVQGRR